MSAFLLISGGIALAAVAALYDESDSEQQEQMRTILNEFDTTLQQLEELKENQDLPNLEEIRKQRERIASFKRLIA